MAHRRFYGLSRNGKQGGRLATRLGLALGPLLLPAPALAKVGKGSCVGTDACTGNTGNIKNRACVGDFACLFNSGAVGNHACVGVEACLNNSGTIWPGQCIGDEVCKDNTNDIP